MKFLLIIFFIFIFILIVFGRIVGIILRFFLSKNNPRGRGGQQQSNRNDNLQTKETEKRFSKDEGEYVSYEEIKEE